MNFIHEVRQYLPKPSTLALYWLGQAGFLLKTAKGRTILIDPYLSDNVFEQTRNECGYAFKRVTPSLFDPDDLTVDTIFCSHEHGDHMDTGSIADLMKNDHSMLYTNGESAKLAVSAGVQIERIVAIERGMTLSFDEFTLVTCIAEHGDLSKEAMGFLFDFGFVRIYYSGDTAYDPKVIESLGGVSPEVTLLPINGVFGNMSAEQAAMLANDIGAKVLIPHHYWMFPKHLGNPQELIEMIPNLAPLCRLCMLTPGERFVCSGDFEI